MEGPYLTKIFRNKWVIAFLLIDIFIVIAIVVVAMNKNAETATLTLNVAPLDAVIKLNGRGGYSPNGIYQVSPGDYHIEVTHPNLTSKTFDLSLEANQAASLTTYLTADGNLDFYKQTENRSSYNQLQAMMDNDINITTDQDDTANEFIAATQGNYTQLDSSLPLGKSYYEETENGRELVWDVTIRANYSDDCGIWLCLEALMYGTEDESIVSQMLEEAGLNAEEYEIHYKNY